MRGGGERKRKHLTKIFIKQDSDLDYLIEVAAEDIAVDAFFPPSLRDCFVF